MKSFGPFRVDTANHCLWRGDETAPLTPGVFLTFCATWWSMRNGW